MSVEQLVDLSRHFGQNSDWVLGGGGNTSVKVDDLLYIKASGHGLASMTPDGLAAMQRSKLADIWAAEYPKETQARERKALADLMDARHPKDTDKRPSVETLMHDALPFTYVIHTHPALLNGITCAQNGEAVAHELFGEQMLWIPLVNPGYVLARTVKDALDEYTSRHNVVPSMLLLQNHGLVIAGEDPAEIRKRHEDVAATVRSQLKREPDFTPAEYDSKGIERLKGAFADSVSDVVGGEEGESRVACLFDTNVEIDRFVADERSFEPLSGAYTPDHIVYAGHQPPFIPLASDWEDQVRLINEAVRGHYERHGYLPPVAAVEQVGVFSMAQDENTAEKALALFEDAVKIAVYASNFGGHRFMDSDQVEFILGWEVEQFRRQVSTG